MELKELRKAIERYKDVRRNIDEFISIYEDELSTKILGTLCSHRYLIMNQITKLSEIIIEIGG